RLEVTKQEDGEHVKTAMPRLQDLFLTYMREMRPQELRGSAGTYRLREGLIARANLAAAPARVTDVLVTQMLIQWATRPNSPAATRIWLRRGVRKPRPTTRPPPNRRGYSIRPRSTACWASMKVRPAAKTAPACRRSSARASYPTSACRCWRSS